MKSAPVVPALMPAQSWWPFGVLLLSLLFTLGFWQRSRAAHQAEIQVAFALQSKNALARIETRLRHYERALLATRGLFAASEGVNRKEFATFVASLDLEPGIQGIGFAALLPAAEKERHVAQVRGQGFPDYQIRPAGNREFYSSIIYLEPFTGRNLRAFGYDMFSEPVRQQAMNRSAETGQISLSGKVQLVQDQEKQVGFLLYVPVYKNGSETATPEARRRNLVGWVYGLFRMNDFMPGVFGEVDKQGVDVELFQGPVSASNLLYDRDTTLHANGHAVIQARHQLTFGGQVWTVVTLPLPGFFARHGDASGTLLLLASLVSLLLGLMTFVLVRHLRQVREHHEELERQVGARTEELRETNAYLENLINYANAPIIVWDPQFRITRFNHAFEHLTGRTEAEVLGQSLELLFPSALVEASMALLRKTIAGERWETVEIKILHRDESVHTVLWNSATLFAPDGQTPVATIAQGHDITVRKRAEASLNSFFEQPMNLHLIATLDGVILRVNEAWEILLGYGSRDLDGTNFMALVHPDDREGTLAEMAKLAQGASIFHFENRYRHKNGGFRVLAWSASVSRADSNIYAVARDITEHKQLEDALKEREEQFRSLFENAPVGIFHSNLEGQMLAANPALAAMLGHASPQALISATSDMTTQIYADPTIRTQVIAALLNTDGWVHYSEVAWRRKDRHLITVEMTGRKVLNAAGAIAYLEGFITDITERRQAEAALRESEEKHRILFRDSPDAYLLVDDGVIVECNRATELMLRGDRTQIIGKTPEALSPEFQPDGLASSKAAKERIREALRTGSSTFEWVHRRLDGSDFCVDVSVASMLLEGKPILFITWRDITEHKQLEAQNRQLQKVESLGRMADSIAHHFNNKLQAVLANLEMMSELPKGMDPARFLSTAKLATEKAAEMSRMMLVYLGQTHLKREPHLLSELCRKDLPLLQKDLPPGVTLETDCPAPGPVICANADQLQQILTSLVTNAWEALGEAEGTVRLSVRTCSAADMPATHRFPFAWRPQGAQYACLEVKDTGCGIAEAEIDKLFDPFFSTKFVGRGLGLSAVLGIVQAHDGAIAVESRPGQGSVFHVYFPVCPEAVPSVSEVMVQVAAPAAGGTILLVDDEEFLLESTGAMIERLGFMLLTAKNGVEALEVFNQHQGEIRCVITDLTMPLMDGWATLTALRQLNPSLPVILASGYDKTQVLSGTHPDLPQVFLNKPFGLPQLRDGLAQALSIH